MNTYSAEALAEAAGVEQAVIDDLVGLGILVPGRGDSFSTGDVRRVRIVESLVRGGLPLPGIAEAIHDGAISLDFVDQPSYDRFAAYADATFRQLSERTGVPLDLLLAVREAMGGAQAAPDDRVRENEIAIVPMLQIQLAQGVRLALVERSLRVSGDSLRRMAETEAAWWGSDIQGPFIAAGRSAAEIGELTARYATELAAATDDAVLAIYHAQQANAWMKNILEGFEMALERSGLHTPLRRPPAICFLDLTGYTRLTEERGDQEAAELAGQLARVVERTALQQGGQPVKWLGDGVMFHFRDPGPAVVAALEMVEAAARAELPRAHVGLHAGPVLFQEGDYFGRTVNIAARIADYARQGEVLVSQAIVDASTGDGVVFEEIGPVELKGVAGSLRLHIAKRARRAA